MALPHVQQDQFVLLRLIRRNLAENLFRNHNRQITKDSTRTPSFFPLLPIRV